MRRVAENLAVAACYLALAKIGFQFTDLHATPVWPPSGIALAFVMLGGYKLLPGVWLGALANSLLPLTDPTKPGMSVISALLVSCGVVIETYTGAYFAGRFSSGSRFPLRARDVIYFAFFSGAISSVFSATVGTTSLFVTGMIGSHLYDRTWFTWWMGDLAGILVFTPLIIAWFLDRNPIARKGEGALLVLTILSIGLYAFRTNNPYHVEYMLLPCLVWAGFRFFRRGATAVTLLISVIAVWGTVNGYGSFSTANRTDSLLALQAFLGVVSMTALILCSVLEERKLKTEEVVDAMNEARHAHAEAEEANRAKSSFLFSMNHELRTPLNHIIGYSDLLMEEAEDSDSKDMIPDLEKIQSSGKQLLRMITDILELSALETGNLEIKISEFPVAPMVRKLETELRAALEKNNNTLTIQCENAPEVIQSDEIRVSQVLRNILENACKFTNDGSLSVGVDSESRNGSSYVRFRVSDTGIGISPEQMNKLFRPFVQVDSSATKKYGGTGLGLALCKLICRRLGGDITVSSQPGKGSVFTVSLPTKMV